MGNTSQEHRTGHSRGFLGLIFGVLVAAAAGYGLVIGLLKRSAPGDVRSAAFLSRVADNVTGLFPRQVDPETEITRLSALEGVLIYHYRLVNVAAASADGALLARLKPMVTKTSCGNAMTLNSFLKKDITLRYLYSDRVGKALVSFDVTLADCGA